MKIPDHLKIFLSGSLISIGGNLIFGFLNYFTRRTMAVTLSEVQYGCFYGVFALISIILVFLDLGVTDAGTVLISENPGRRKTIYFTLWKWKAAVGCLCTVILLCFSPLISQTYLHGQGMLMMVFLAIYTAFQALNGTFISYTMGRKQYQIKSLFQIIKAIFVLVMVWFFSPIYGAAGAALGYLLATIIIEPCHIGWVCKHESGTKMESFDKDLAKRTFSLIGAVAAITSIQALILHMNSLMLMVLQGSKSTAVFNIAAPITQLILSFLVFANVFLPLAVDMVRQKDYIKLRRYAFGFLAVSIVLLPLVFLVIKYSGEFLITFLFKASYAKEAATPLLLLMLGFMLYSFGSFMTQILVAMQKLKALLWISGLTVLVNLILNYVLIVKYDVVGAAAATALSYLFFSALAFLFFCRHTNSKPENAAL